MSLGLTFPIDIFCENSKEVRGDRTASESRAGESRSIIQRIIDFILSFRVNTSNRSNRDSKTDLKGREVGRIEPENVESETHDSVFKACQTTIKIAKSIIGGNASEEERESYNNEVISLAEMIGRFSSTHSSEESLKLIKAIISEAIEKGELLSNFKQRINGVPFSTIFLKGDGHDKDGANYCGLLTLCERAKINQQILKKLIDECKSDYLANGKLEQVIDRLTLSLENLIAIEMLSRDEKKLICLNFARDLLFTDIAGLQRPNPVENLRAILRLIEQRSISTPFDAESLLQDKEAQVIEALKKRLNDIPVEVIMRNPEQIRAIALGVRALVEELNTFGLRGNKEKIAEILVEELNCRLDNARVLQEQATLRERAVLAERLASEEAEASERQLQAEAAAAARAAAIYDQAVSIRESLTEHLQAGLDRLRQNIDRYTELQQMQERLGVVASEIRDLNERIHVARSRETDSLAGFSDLLTNLNVNGLDQRISQHKTKQSHEDQKFAISQLEQAKSTKIKERDKLQNQIQRHKVAHKIENVSGLALLKEQEAWYVERQRVLNAIEENGITAEEFRLLIESLQNDIHQMKDFPKVDLPKRAEVVSSEDDGEENRSDLKSRQFWGTRPWWSTDSEPVSLRKNVEQDSASGSSNPSPRHFGFNASRSLRV